MENQMVRVAKEFAKDESGVGVVEMILIRFPEPVLL